MFYYYQPHRPTRPGRVYGDENAMPAVGAPKTLHKRNQSSPALSTMLQAGALKFAAKRTAFGDVSNTANVLRPSKDDSTIGVKGDYSITEKTIPTQQEKKTTSFLRPAQRPLSVSGLKGYLNNITSSTNQQTLKQPLLEAHQPLQQATQATNTVKVQTKKNTAIFKDTAPAKPEQPVPDPHKPLPSIAPIAPVHRELLPRPPTKKSDDYREPQPTLSITQSKHKTDPAPPPPPPPAAVEPPHADTSSEAGPAIRSDGVYIDDQGRVQFFGYAETVEKIEVVEIPVEKAVSLPANVSKETTSKGIDQLLNAQFPKPQPEPARRATLAPVSEPEEYWDDEGEENYDEDGYVTARSFKSRGENTTGGATTVLFPKLNQKARREIAVAKELVEGSKTAEELEDEAWDTTMVAEYGEEIFQYMKDLEVMSFCNDARLY